MNSKQITSKIYHECETRLNCFGNSLQILAVFKLGTEQKRDC